MRSSVQVSDPSLRCSMSWAMHASTVGSNPIGSRRLVGLFRAYAYMLIPPRQPDRVLADEAGGHRVVPAVADVVEAGDGVQLAGHVAQRLLHALRHGRHLAPG